MRHEATCNELGWALETRVATAPSVDGAAPLSYPTQWLQDELGNVFEERRPFGDTGTSFTRIGCNYGMLNELLSEERGICWRDGNRHVRLRRGLQGGRWFRPFETGSSLVERSMTLPPGQCHTKLGRQVGLDSLRSFEEGTEVSFRVRVPTNRTVEGPSLKMARGRLVVGYDFEDDDGSLEQARLVFVEVLSFEYRDSACCQAENVLPPTQVRAQDQSGYLDSVRSQWEERVGWQERQRELGGVTRFKHFSIYFEDVACVDVIASSCQVDG